MTARYLLAGMLSTGLAFSAGGVRADDDALRALGLGLSIINNLQQQQQQQQRRQQPVPQQQSSPKRQSAAPARQAPRQQDTAAAQRQRAEVEQVQSLLNRLGYDAGPVDGDPGPRTRDAIAQFRADYGLSPGRDVDSELVGALRVAGRDAPAVASGAGRRPGALQAANPPLWNEPEQGFAAVAAGTAPPRAAATPSGILMIGDRVAAATNTSFGDLGAAFEGYDLVSNLRRVVFSAALSASPGMLDDDEQAVAALEMVDPVLAGEIIEEGLGRPLSKSEGYEISNGFINERFMPGLDPFAEQAILAAVRADRARLTVPDAPAPPIPLTVFCEVRLMAYDFETGSFPIVSTSCDEAPFGIGRVRTEGPDPVPEGLPMPPEEAQVFLSTKYAKSYLAALDAVLAIDPGPGGAPVMTLSGRTGLRLLAPRSLTDVVYDFGQIDQGGASRPALDGGLYRVDGRIAASTRELSSYAPELDLAGMESGIERLAFAYDQALRPDAALDDAAAIAALRMLPAGTASAIVQGAIQRPLSDWQRAQLESGDFSGMLETPFERKRAAEAIRTALDENAGPLPELPLKLRVYCGVELGAYDFDAGGFPFARSSCDDGVGGLKGVELSGESPLPALLAMPPEEAEAFAAARSYFFFLASFDADLDFKVKRTELGAILSNRRGLRLHGHKDPAEITWVAPAEAAASAPVAAPPPVERGPWVLHDAEDQAEMVALAGAPKSFPADGAAL
ncbi:MAG TPA: peptidoglycan-binding domain-containing protein, partial [Amaricoccus sp.]|nr:peptidoglycan-binding domain-containing protein [Amaricoccus sp.]